MDSVGFLEVYNVLTIKEEVYISYLEVLRRNIFPGAYYCYYLPVIYFIGEVL